MKLATKVAVGFLLISAALVSTVEVRRYRTPAETIAATAGFSGERAFDDLQELVRLGPRPPGSQALQQAREYITRQLAAAGAKVWDDSFVAVTPVGKIPMTNVIGAFRGGSDGLIVLAGHYDTARLNDVSFVGANDGGSSAAFLLEVARALSHRKKKLTYWVVFFDGEEALQQWSATDSLYGSRHLAARLAVSGELRRIRALIVLDMVGDRHLDILRESNSTPWLSELIFSEAQRLGYASHFAGGTYPVEDDHLPFVQEGVPAVDLIDVTPFKSYHHTIADTVDKCAPQSLAIVGQVVLATLETLEGKFYVP